MSEEQKYQADNNNGLEDLFRKTLGDHQIEPSGNLWKGISRKLLWIELTHFNFSNLPRAFWVGMASTFLVGMIFLVSQIPDGKVTENSYSPAIPEQGIASTPSSSITKTSFSHSFTINHHFIAPVTSFTPTKNIANGSIISSDHPSPGTLTARNRSQSTTPVDLAFLGTTRKFLELSYMTYYSTLFLFPHTAMDTVLRFITQNTILNVPKTTMSIPRFFTLDLGISPEVTVYHSQDLYSKTNYWLNAGMTYHAGRFSLHTGLGLGYVFDQGNYRVNYTSKDSIGYFTSIISFTVTEDNKVVFTTKNIPVYDSIQHIADDRGNNRYTYLQIPLLLGFEIIETNHLTLGIEAGPAVSFLIGSKEAVPFIDYPNAHLVLVENRTMQNICT